jgi:hypothetical protein
LLRSLRQEANRRIAGQENRQNQDNEWQPRPSAGAEGFVIGMGKDSPSER